METGKLIQHLYNLHSNMQPRSAEASTLFPTSQSVLDIICHGPKPDLMQMNVGKMEAIENMEMWGDIIFQRYLFTICISVSPFQLIDKLLWGYLKILTLKVNEGLPWWSRG